MTHRPAVSGLGFILKPPENAEFLLNQNVCGWGLGIRWVSVSLQVIITRPTPGRSRNGPWEGLGLISILQIFAVCKVLSHIPNLSDFHNATR